MLADVAANSTRMLSRLKARQAERAKAHGVLGLVSCLLEGEVVLRFGRRSLMI